MTDTPTRPWTLETAPQPSYDWARMRFDLRRGWYAYVYCLDADELIGDGFDGCCDVMIFGPFHSRDEADEVGMDITVDVGPWYHELVEVTE